MRWLTRRRRHDEDGVTAIFVMIMMVALLGMAGYVIDVGAVREERRELQNGADAAALAAAQECARTPAACTTGGLQSLADGFANGSATDGQSAVVAIVPTAAPAGGNVRVDTRTRTSGGASSLTTKFAQLVGAPASSTVNASATASWFAPSSSTEAIPLTISWCQYSESLSAGGGNYPTGDLTIYFHDPTANQNQAGSPGCGGPANQNMPGGFGWLDVAAGCRSQVSDGGLYGSEPGNSPPNPSDSGCTPERFLTTDLLIPVFSSFSGNGQAGTYQIYGMATFRMSAMRLGGNGSIWTSSPPPPNCTSSQRCIYGHFVRDVILCPCGPPSTHPPMGTFAVKLTA